MKKFLAAISALIVNLIVILPAYAKSPCPQGFEALCKLDPNQNPAAFDNLFSGILITLLTISVVVSVCFLIWGGTKYIKASGDKAQIDGAKQTIIGAVIGMIVSFLAFFIINLVAFMFTGENLSGLAIPKLVP